MDIFLNIIAILLIIWILLSPMLLIYHSFNRNDNSKINYFYDKFSNAILLGSLFFLVKIIGSGISNLLSFVPNTWGYISDNGDYTPYTISISYLISTILSLGIIYLLVTRYDYLNNEKLLINENKKKLKLSYFFCKIHFGEGNYTCIAVRDKISYMTKTYINDDLLDNEVPQQNLWVALGVGRPPRA